MIKYGVDETPSEGQKEAQASVTCPKCGQQLIVEGKVRLCPVHGSEPFEAYEHS
jgi:ribosomal protein L37E